MPGVEHFIGPGERPQQVADAMHKAWIGFINHGDPGWATYDAAERSTMIFDEPCTVASDPAATERQAWEGIR